MTATVTATASVPFLFRFMLLTLEPLATLNGAFLTQFKPASYLALMTRDAVPFAADTKFLYTTITGGWLHFAFIQAVVMRVFDDLRLWRLCCFSMLLSDLLYNASTVEAAGGWSAWSDVERWTVNDWVINAFNMTVMLVRVCVVLGIGIKRTAPGSKREK